MIVSLVNLLSVWVIPVLIVLVVLIALLRRVNVFDVFIEGAKEGFKMSVRLIPFLVGMLVAIGLFRDSGLMDLCTNLITPLLVKLNIPAEIVPLAIMRRFRGAPPGRPRISCSRRARSLLGEWLRPCCCRDHSLYHGLFWRSGIYKTRHALVTGLRRPSGFIATIDHKVVFG